MDNYVNAVNLMIMYVAFNATRKIEFIDIVRLYISLRPELVNIANV